MPASASKYIPYRYLSAWNLGGSGRDAEVDVDMRRVG